MNERPAHETLLRFTIAAAALARHKPETDTTGEQVTVIFMAICMDTTREARRDLSNLASQKGKDIVCLEFEPGEEEFGPRRITVYELKDRGVSIWRNGVIWASDDDGGGFIVPDEGNVRFSYDGTHLRRFDRKPLQPALDQGIARARRIMRQMADEVPQRLVSGGARGDEGSGHTFH